MSISVTWDATTKWALWQLWILCFSGSSSTAILWQNWPKQIGQRSNITHKKKKKKNRSNIFFDSIKDLESCCLIYIMWIIKKKNQIRKWKQPLLSSLSDTIFVKLNNIHDKMGNLWGKYQKSWTHISFTSFEKKIKKNKKFGWKFQSGEFF